MLDRQGLQRPDLAALGCLVDVSSQHDRAIGIGCPITNTADDDIVVAARP